MQAYRTWLGFYKGSMKLCRWNAEQLVQAANRYAVTLGELLGQSPCQMKIKAHAWIHTHQAVLHIPLIWQVC